ncbi:hypothetical protein [Agromyces kandeliae]|uniref:Uncharacterized protein n=1 Tax=Agromyces kandeliae TaxID=2666141 RepID=A0A6L5QX32_9MICO|nr:hypothetical protein [Agromyces kandeliae]MRX42340.1 hypothetical protein [Agromyces kandeliae]
MDLPRLIVIVLYVLGLVLPVLGSVRAYLHAKDTLEGHAADILEYDRLEREHDTKREAIEDWNDAPDVRAARLATLDAEYSAAFERLGIEAPTWGNLSTVGERAVLKALRLIGRGNVGNALLVGVGLLCGTVASIWALFLPPA